LKKPRHENPIFAVAPLGFRASSFLSSSGQISEAPVFFLFYPFYGHVQECDQLALDAFRFATRQERSCRLPRSPFFLVRTSISSSPCPLLAHHDRGDTRLFGDPLPLFTATPRRRSFSCIFLFSLLFDFPVNRSPGKLLPPLILFDSQPLSSFIFSIHQRRVGFSTAVPPPRFQRRRDVCSFRRLLTFLLFFNPRPVIF